MTVQDYEQVTGELMAAAKEIEERKRPGYTRGDADVLKNFKRAALNNNCTPEQAWGILIDKHWDAVKSIMLRPDLPISEEPLGRFADMINYLRLGFALMREREPAIIEYNPTQETPEQAVARVRQAHQAYAAQPYDSAQAKSLRS
jgi:hypothetical protein